MTSERDTSQYVKNGVRYGVTEGRFRGRWWNYYERGRSFADGQFWAEAEQDLRIALSGRAKDQLWARTYGLHFTPEYFPHRELGIVLYQQGRLEEAMAELETSWGQQHSARAAYYLDEARRAWVLRESADAEAPAIEVAAPTARIADAAVEISGLARDDTFIKRITVGGEEYPLPVSRSEVRFSQSAPLRPLSNRIEVVVEDIAGKTTASVVTVVADLDGPALSFDEPVALPGMVRGVAYDKAGVEAVELNGKQAVLSDTGDGLFSFSVEMNRDELTPPLIYEARDMLGNVTRGPLPLDALLVSDIAPTAVFAACPDIVPVAQGLQAVVLGAQILAIAAVDSRATMREQPDVRFANLREGQRYFLDEIVVALDVDAAQPIERVQLNGMPIETIPGRAVQHLSRRVSLEPGENPVLASAADATGREGMASVTVERRLTEVERLERRLSAAVLGNVWEGNSPELEGETELIIDTLERELLYHYKRFEIVGRELLQEILAEQQLSAALGSKDYRLKLGELVPAEVLLIGRVHRDADTIEIVAEAVSSETSFKLARADVAGPAETPEELERLVKDLALRVVQEFPLAQSQVLLVKSPEKFIAGLSENDGIRTSMKYIVFRYGEEITHPETGQSLGRDTEIIGEALVAAVDDRKSTAEMVKFEDEPPQPVERGCYVVTK